MPTNLLIVNSVLVSIPYLTGSTVAYQIAQHVLKISFEDHSDTSQTTFGPFDCFPEIFFCSIYTVDITASRVST